MEEESNNISFEKALKNLEEIVHELEKEDVPLEKAIDYYQQGMKMSKICDEKLQSAEEKMTQIMKEDEKLEPFNLQGE